MFAFFPSATAASFAYFGKGGKKKMLIFSLSPSAAEARFSYARRTGNTVPKKLNTVLYPPGADGRD